MLRKILVFLSLILIIGQFEFVSMSPEHPVDCNGDVYDKYNNKIPLTEYILRFAEGLFINLSEGKEVRVKTFKKILKGKFADIKFNNDGTKIIMAGGQGLWIANRDGSGLENICDDNVHEYLENVKYSEIIWTTAIYGKDTIRKVKKYDFNKKSPA